MTVVLVPAALVAWVVGFRWLTALSAQRIEQ